MNAPRSDRAIDAARLPPERESALRVICAWCGCVLDEGPLGALTPHEQTSHGICPRCQETWVKQRRSDVPSTDRLNWTAPSADDGSEL